MLVPTSVKHVTHFALQLEKENIQVFFVPVFADYNGILSTHWKFNELFEQTHHHISAVFEF